jgi:hypothetical protein
MVTARAARPARQSPAAGNQPEQNALGATWPQGCQGEVDVSQILAHARCACRRCCHVRTQYGVSSRQRWRWSRRCGVQSRWRLQRRRSRLRLGWCGSGSRPRPSRGWVIRGLRRLSGLWVWLWRWVLGARSSGHALWPAQSSGLGLRLTTRHHQPCGARQRRPITRLTGPHWLGAPADEAARPSGVASGASPAWSGAVVR